MITPTRLTLDRRINHMSCQAMKWLFLVIALGNRVMQDELLPRSKDGIEGPAAEWAPHDLVEPRYGCDCPFYRARYFCPNLGVGGSFKWVPRAVADGICQEKSFDQIADAPLPPDFRVLVYGNSHLRQVVEGMMCMFQQPIERKRITIGGHDMMVPSDTQCRSCTDSGLKELLRGHNCLSVDVNCTCSDDRGEFFFENGAVIHYAFAHHEEAKQIEFGLLSHNTSTSYYDIVVANSGNRPYLNQSSLLQSAVRMQNEGVQLIWLSEYGGVGDISDWETSKKTHLAGAGALFLPVHYMVHGLAHWTKGFVVDGVTNGDPHYCLPGPPDQIGLLLLRIMWALYDEWGGTRHTVEGEVTQGQDTLP